MIPIGTDVRLRTRPVGNWALIAVNVAVALAEWTHPAGRALVDALLPPLHAAVPSLSEYLSYQFRHGDQWHLLGNMLFLWIFGNAVCDRMGSLNYVVFYLAGGVFAGAVYTHFNSSPMLGASGAIAGVTTAFMVLYPRVHVTMLIWFFIITTIQVPAIILILFKIVLWDNVFAPNFGGGADYANVAYSAHLGGYAFGFLISAALLAIRALPRNQFDLLAVWSRWNRRTGTVGQISFKRADAQHRRPTQSRPPPSAAPPTAADSLREDVLDRLAEHDFDEAAHLYHRMRELDAQVALPRAQQLELANHLAQTRRHAEAVEAYEAFLRIYPSADDAPQVRLLVGLVCRRHLGDHPRAAEHFRAAQQGLTLASQRQLAEEELRIAEANISEPTAAEGGEGDNVKK